MTAIKDAASVFLGSKRVDQRGAHTTTIEGGA
jgi:hypothetical protein